jgi:regulation of enolase protein 1 (concanavalin A-like superfamily)
MGQRQLISVDKWLKTAGMITNMSRKRSWSLGVGAGLLVLVAACASGAGAGEDEKAAFQDAFKGKLGPGWSWIREDAKHWRLGEQGLEVLVQPGNMWGASNNAKNVLVRAVADPERDPVEITAAVFNQPTAQYEQVDLVWYYDDSHMVKIGQELVDGKLSIVMGREENDKTRTIAIIPLDSDSVEVRFQAKGKRIRGQFKTPRGEWRDAGECDLPVKGPPRISLQFYQGPKDQEHWARVSSFTIRRAP